MKSALIKLTCAWGSLWGQRTVSLNIMKSTWCLTLTLPPHDSFVFLFLREPMPRLALATFSRLSLLWNLWLKRSHLFYCLSHFFPPCFEFTFLRIKHKFLQLSYLVWRTKQKIKQKAHLHKIPEVHSQSAPLRVSSRKSIAGRWSFWFGFMNI